MPRFTKNPILSERFGIALNHAAVLHFYQVRKGPLSKNTPYLAHLMGVAALVLEDGGNEDEAIAALLHDSAEDIGANTIDTIRQLFGPRVVEIVMECSDSGLTLDEKLPWRERKEVHLQHARTMSESGLKVLLADKRYNLESLISEWNELGNEIWEHFNAGKENTLWYYHEMDAIFQWRCEGRMQQEFSDRLERWARDIARRSMAEHGLLDSSRFPLGAGAAE
jgi:(p)ppGpp synthase/HD superfamily hydrolase